MDKPVNNIKDDTSVLSFADSITSQGANTLPPTHCSNDKNYVSEIASAASSGLSEFVIPNTHDGLNKKMPLFDSAQFQSPEFHQLASQLLQLRPSSQESVKEPLFRFPESATCNSM